jgi:hypothetical protein
MGAQAAVYDSRASRFLAGHRKEDGRKRKQEVGIASATPHAFSCSIRRLFEKLCLEVGFPPQFTPRESIRVSVFLVAKKAVSSNPAPPHFSPKPLESLRRVP